MYPGYLGEEASWQDGFSFLCCGLSAELRLFLRHSMGAGLFTVFLF